MRIKASLQDAAVAAILDCASLDHERGHFQHRSGWRRDASPPDLRKTAQRAATDWSLWHVYFSDERCVPPTEEELNSRIAGDAWLDYVPIPGEQIHVIPGGPRADKAAAEYAESAAERGTFRPDPAPDSDQIGHTAEPVPWQ
jgi:6-phosphogluconolactonase